MVGVPRSKGCATCRKRSIKCDEAHPGCSQCRRGGRTCPGYVRDLKFVDEGSRFHQNQGPRFVDEGLRFQKKHSSPPRHNISTVSVRGPPWEPQHRTQIVASFVRDLFPLNQGSPQSSFIGGWLWLVPSVLHQSMALDYAAEAVALGYFGRQSRSKARLVRSYHLYEGAVRSLRKALHNPQHRLSSETLCAALLLLHYERLLQPIDTSWISHAGGIRGLIQQRGSHSYRTGIDHAILMASRGYIVTECLLSKEACFLDEENWKDVQFAATDSPLAPANYVLYHEGLNHFAAVPRLLHGAKSVKSQPGTADSDMYMRAQNLRSNMMLWHDALDSALELAAQNRMLDHIGNYMYSDSISASFAVNYCAYMILINQVLDQSQYSLVYTKENYVLARDIGRSTAYCIRTGFCGQGAMGMALPIALTAAADEDKDWISASLKSINDLEKPPI